MFGVSNVVRCKFNDKTKFTGKISIQFWFWVELKNNHIYCWVNILLVVRKLNVCTECASTGFICVSWLSELFHDQNYIQIKAITSDIVLSNETTTNTTLSWDFIFFWQVNFFRLQTILEMVRNNHAHGQLWYIMSYTIKM